ncbi:SusD family protein [Chitinophaga costaii]|uniref:SusD family protein n=1 Tax=Chitinophaga costaii TaxID=1335309 RepID=A0A1C4EFZ4_9BACT|nr:RagB/SusD family nutrient uptake outer membrane protein [Chitinophaga costaii]PUZ23850.1 RagB/SusD family nutrient uptake outer membrane protein [Chitinophaga costaii]SCC42480.1 SusD family protein [Chitinophaga costaii]
MRKILAWPLYISLILVFSQCKKSFLEVVPQGNQVAVTTSDYDLLMNDPNFYNEPYAGGWQEPVLMGDEVSALGAYQDNLPVPFEARLFQWQDKINYEEDPLPFFITNCLGYMYTFNKVISEVDGATEGTDAQKTALKAEAKANRAFLNYSLINYYAKPYVAATAATDPGFPIITEAAVTGVTYNRGTVQQMYDFIIQDLKDAVAGLPVQQLYKTRFSRPAAEGLLGKVYLFMGRSSDALPLLNAAFADLATAGNTTLYDYNQTFAPGGAFLPIDPTFGPASNFNSLTDLTEDVVTRMFINSTFSGNQLGNDGLVLSNEDKALYDPRDLRLLLYTQNDPDGNSNPNGLLRKYGSTYTRWGLQLSELYLLRAECKARLNDLPGAIADLEVLRSHRMPANIAPVPAVAAASQAALVHFIIDERIREFALEGYRWFDMRRLSVDPLYAGITFTHIHYNTDGTTTSYTLNQPNRLVLQLPPKYIETNPGMENNP